MPGCALFSCKNRFKGGPNKENISFHTFPKNKEALRKWVEFVSYDRNDMDWMPSQGSVLCSEHFLDSDKRQSKQGRHFLMSTALPTKKENKSTPLSRRDNHLENCLKIEIKKKKKLSERISQLRRRNKLLSAKIYQLKKENQELIKILNALKKNALISPFLLDKLQNLIADHGKKSQKKRGKLQYSILLKKFALTLHFYSPSAYKFVRQHFDKLLPHPSTLKRWHSSFDAEPGFTAEAFKALHLKSKALGKPLICSLVFDEMSIRAQKIWQKDQYVGFVDYGFGNYETKLAKECLVFMVVSLTENWKIPVGYFLVNGTDAKTKANLIQTCLAKCFDAGVKIANITFDGCRTNFKTVELLGCNLDLNNLKTHFPHPTTNEKVVVFPDPCHMLKLVRNHFSSKGLIFGEQNNKIEWRHIINLHNLQKDVQLRFGNKLTQRHIQFRNQIMKVHLAAQLLSVSVAKALECCENELKLGAFNNTAPTSKFITIINNIFDVLNSRKSEFYGFKRPLDEKNHDTVFEFLEKAKSYIKSLKIYSKAKPKLKGKKKPRVSIKIKRKLLIKSAAKTGFLGFLICIESLKVLYDEYILNKKELSYISFYRLSQDHLELFFSLIRKHGGFNNNPNYVQFRAAYKKSLAHFELKSSFSGNCIPLDNFTILNCSSVDVINNTSLLSRNRNESSSVDNNECGELDADIASDFNCQLLSEIMGSSNIPKECELIVGYIAGWVSKKLTKKLKCEACVSSLFSEEKLWFHKLIVIKDMGGLCYSSEDVFKICLKTEQVIRILTKQNKTSDRNKHANLAKIISHTLQSFLGVEIFQSLITHSFENPATFNHRIHIIRAIIEEYTKVKMHFAAKSDTFEKKMTNRQKLTKLILFEGN